MPIPMSRNSEVKNIIRGLNLTRTLFVSSIIIGEPYTGKRTLVRSIFPNTPVVDGSSSMEYLERVLSENSELIIESFEKVKEPLALNFDNKRVIAISDTSIRERDIDELFAFIYRIPSLKDRVEDIPVFKDYYIKKACQDLMIDSKIEIDETSLDISANLKSLKASVYKEALCQTSDKERLKRALYHYFMRNLDEPNGYKEHLELFERALLEAGLQKFGSQLKLSNVLGINRNTLRKKLNEYSIN